MSAPGDADPRGVDVDGLDELRELVALGDHPTFRASTVRKIVGLKINYRERAVAAESRLAASEADRAALERRVAELTEALGPFARASDEIRADLDDMAPMHWFTRPRFFRAAARALTPGASS